MSISAIFWKSCQDMENWKNFLMLNSCFRGQRHCRSVATRKNIHQRIRFVPICRLQKAALILAGTDYGAFTKNLVRTVEASGVIPNKSFKVHVIDPIRNPNVFYAFYFQNSDLLLITGCTRTKIKANRRKLQIASPNGHLCHIRRTARDIISGQAETH